jgi:hypothetical protein
MFDCYIRIVKRLSSLAVPYHSSLTLVRDTDCFNLVGRKSFLGELFDCFFDATSDGGYQLEGIMLVPSDQTS